MIEFLESVRISRTGQNCQKMLNGQNILELLEDDRIFGKYSNFQKMPKFLENTGIDRKFQNFQKMLEYL